MAGLAGRRLAQALGLLGAVLALTWWGLRPPAPLPAGAPGDRFSAGRAAGVLEDLYEGLGPHPVGSDANRRLRRRLVERLRGMGYQPEIQRELACRESHPTCAVVENILARLEGRPGRKAVMLSTHYDSVPAGPGVSDAGVSVAAVLEIARILRESPAGANPVIFFIGDGEEAGLLGARAFVGKHRWAPEVGAVVNLEARGTSGRSWMFETSAGGAWLVRAYARSAPHPATASVAYAVYKRLPTDTDLTVYKAHGLHGVGLAFSEGYPRYHTSRDSLEFLHLPSLQQQGANALALVRELSGMDLDSPRKGEAVFFDLFGLVTVRWPASAARWMAAAGLLLSLAAAASLAARGRCRPRALLAGVAAWLGSAAAGTAAGLGVGALLDAAGAFPTAYPAHSWAHQGAAWGAGCLAAVLFYGFLCRGAGVWGLLGGSILAWGLLGAGLTLADPALSYLAVAPALAGGASLLLAALRGGARPPAAPLLLLVATGAPALAQLLLVLFGAMGRAVLPALSLLAAMMLSLALSPLAGSSLRARRGLALLALAATAGFGAGAWILPPWTPALPRRLSLAHHQEAGSGSAWWAFYGRRPLPAGLLEAAGGEVRRDRALPWWGWDEELAAAPPHGLEGPRAELVEGGEAGPGGTVSLHLTSPRGASLLDVVLPGERRLVEVTYPGVGSSALGEGSAHSGGTWHSWRFLSPPPGGLNVKLVPGAGGPLRMWLMDRSPGLPDFGTDLLAARPAEAVPSQTGDVTVVYREVRFPLPAPAREAGEAPASPPAE